MDKSSFKYYVFYDLETTGMNPAFDQILQFAAVKTDLNFNQTFTYCLDNSGESDVSLSQTDNSYIILDSNLFTHNTSQKYGTYIGNYVFIIYIHDICIR